MTNIMKKFDAILASSYNNPKIEKGIKLRRDNAIRKFLDNEFPDYEEIWSMSSVEELEQWMWDSIPRTEIGTDVFNAIYNIIERYERLANTDFHKFLYMVETAIEYVYIKWLNKCRDYLREVKWPVNDRRIISYP